MRSTGSRLAVGLIATGLLIAGHLAGADRARARPLDEVTASGVLRVVVYDDNAPFSSLEAGEPQGIDVEIGKALAKSLGVAADIIVRIQGEDVEQDLRANVVRGTLGGGIAGDVMLHVPVDREISARFKEAAISNAYFRQRVALALPATAKDKFASFDTFETAKVGVQLGTVADYFLMRYGDGKLVANVSHYLKPTQAGDRLAKGEIMAVFGVQSGLEPVLKAKGIDAVWLTPEAPGLVRQTWTLGTAVNERSRDLGYAIGQALTNLAEDGTLKAIFERHGVTYVAP